MKTEKPHRIPFEKRSSNPKEPKTLGDIIDRFNKCITAEDFKRFYLWYWKLIEETICKEKDIQIGDKRPLGETYERVRSNLFYIFGNNDDMRIDYAKKIWWFL
jgi:hypothetical protein